MVKVTNLTREGIDFVVGPGKGGVPETQDLAGGATDNIAIDMNSAHVRGLIFAGAIEVSGSDFKKVVTAVADEPSAAEVPAKRRGGRPRKSRS
jgi:hypothetical protein